MHGQPRAIYQRAIERGNLLVAEAMLRELGRPSLIELLELTALIAQKDPRRHGRVATRWLQRYLEVRGDATIDEAILVAAALQELDGHWAVRFAVCRHRLFRRNLARQTSARLRSRPALKQISEMADVRQARSW